MKLYRFALPILIAVFVILATAYSVTVPLGEAPDEVSHFSYVQYLVFHQQLPPPEGPASGESNQPPLYYVLGALTTLWNRESFPIIANPDWELGSTQTNNLLLHTRRESFPYSGGALAWHLVRALSIVFGAFTVWLTWQLSLQVFPDDIPLALTATSLVAFLPQFGFLNAVVNNDSLVIMLVTCAMFLFLRLSPATRPRDWILLGVVLGLAVLAKLQAAVLVMVVGVIVFFRFNLLSLPQRIRRLILVFMTSAVVISPWVIYNTVVFNDPFSLTRFMNVVPRTALVTVSDWLIYFERMYVSFWGRMGGVTNVAIPMGAFVLLNVLWFLGLAGSIVLFRDWRAGRLPTSTSSGLVAFGLYWFFLIAAHLRLVFVLDGMDQARQIFTGLPLFAIIVAAGLVRISKQRRASVALVITVVLAGNGVWSWSSVANAFAPPPSLVASYSTTFDDLGGIIRAGDYRINRTQVRAGDSVKVKIRWQALVNVKENYWLVLQLSNANGIVASRDGVPSAGQVATDWWQAGYGVESEHTLTIPADASPGEYFLRLGLHPFGSWELLAMGDQDMVMLGEIQITAP
jgi:4-amino-4-deoxy-L-arabinose transferase-like glycosyltransferase